MLLTILLQAVAADVLGKAGIALAAAVAALAAGYGIGKSVLQLQSPSRVSRKPAEASVLQ